MENKPIITVRKVVSEDDAPTLARMNVTMAKETENKDLDLESVIIATKRQIAQPKLGIYFLAETKGENGETITVGTTAVTLEMQPRIGGVIQMIQSVYVEKEWRKKGVFRALYNNVIEGAKADPITKEVRLYVEKENTVAITVYEKLGMKRLDGWSFDEKDFVLPH